MLTAEESSAYLTILMLAMVVFYYIKERSIAYVEGKTYIDFIREEYRGRGPLIECVAVAPRKTTMTVRGTMKTTGLDLMVVDDYDYWTTLDRRDIYLIKNK